MIIGLTGGMGSGKSTVAQMFQELGAEVLDVDKIGHQVILPHTPAWKKIVTFFGKDILQEDLKIDRERLGRIVFNDYRLLQELNAITHPEIIKLVKEKIEQVKKRSEKNDFTKSILIIDAALIYETKMKQLMDKIIVVYVKEEEQIKRLKKRSHLSRGEILKRIRAQIPLKEKIKMADYVIDNNYSLYYTREQVQRIWAEFTTSLPLGSDQKRERVKEG